VARTLRGNRFGFSGGASLVAMVQTADLRQRDDSAHFSWLNQARLRSPSLTKGAFSIGDSKQTMKQEHDGVKLR